MKNNPIVAFATSLLAVVALAALPAFAHGGKNHRLMGTVKTVESQSLVVTATDGHDVTVALTEKTQYEQAGKPAQRSSLKAGVRVSIQLGEDDKTALTVKIALSPPA